MKIALCLSGHTRNYVYNYPNLSLNSDEFNVDTFISTVWQSGLPDKTTPSYISYHSQPYNITTQINVADILTKYKPVLYKIEEDYNITSELMQFKYQKTLHNADLSHIGMMFYRIYQANELKKQYEQSHNFKYDYVIRSRFDIKINELSIDLSKIHIWIDKEGMCDLFFAGNSDTMDKICEIYNWFISQDIVFLQNFNSAEHILKYYINTLNLNLGINMMFGILFTKDYPIQSVEIKNGNKRIIYG